MGADKKVLKEIEEVVRLWEKAIRDEASLKELKKLYKLLEKKRNEFLEWQKLDLANKITIQMFFVQEMIERRQAMVAF
jgi:hypothetical protein